ncbi:uncharacterized protein LOC111349416 [Spodoptera litura]|uniref:Uncharacterized protein LOC111349416 n=1 Tax=Spodoptera litura TaxID=69820 RepID=A0A9J7DQB1_SPOLT|nr:uncharacterized protein LOC111349416 [Spodoptera litura]
MTLDTKMPSLARMPSGKIEAASILHEAMKKHHLTPADLENMDDKHAFKKLCKSKSVIVHLNKNEIVNKLCSEAGEGDIVYAIRKAIRRGDVSPSLLDMVINNEVHLGLNEHRLSDYLGSKNLIKPMCKREIFFKLRTDEGVDNITKRVADAIKMGKVSPYLIEMMLNKDKEIKFLKKKEAHQVEPITKEQIIRKLCSRDGELYIIKEVRKAIRKGLVPPSVIQNIIDKESSKTLFKRLSSKKCETMNKYEVLNRLGTKDGESEIMKQIDKAITSGHLSPSALELMINGDVDRHCEIKKIKNKRVLAGLDPEVAKEMEKAIKKGEITKSLANIIKNKAKTCRKVNKSQEHVIDKRARKCDNIHELGKVKSKSTTPIKLRSKSEQLDTKSLLPQIIPKIICMCKKLQTKNEKGINMNVQARDKRKLKHEASLAKLSEKHKKRLDIHIQAREARRERRRKHKASLVNLAEQRKQNKLMEEELWSALSKLLEENKHLMERTSQSETKSTTTSTKSFKFTRGRRSRGPVARMPNEKDVETKRASNATIRSAVKKVRISLGKRLSSPSIDILSSGRQSARKPCMSTGQLLQPKIERKRNESLQLRDMEVVRKKMCKSVKTGRASPSLITMMSRKDMGDVAHTSNYKTQVISNILNAIKRGSISPAILYDVLYNVKPSDTKSQVIEKVLNAIAKRHVTPTNMQTVMTEVYGCDSKTPILNPVRDAVKKEKIPVDVLRQVLDSVEPNEDRCKIVAKIRKALEKSLLSQNVIDELLFEKPDEELIPRKPEKLKSILKVSSHSETTSHKISASKTQITEDSTEDIVKKVHKAVAEGNLSPAVLNDLKKIQPKDKKTQVLKKVRKAIAKYHVTPSARDQILYSINEKDDKAKMLKKVRKAAEKGEIPIYSLSVILDSLRPNDSRAEVMEKIKKGRTSD